MKGGQEFSEVIRGRFSAGEETFGRLFKGHFLELAERRGGHFGSDEGMI